MFEKIVALSLMANILLSGPIVGPLNLNMENHVTDNASVKVNDKIIADYNEIEFYGVRGSVLNISIRDKSLLFSSDNAGNFKVQINNVNTLRNVVYESTNNSVFEIDLTNYINGGLVFFIDMTYELDGVNYHQNDIYLCVDKSRQLHFAKSPNYDFNVERTSELWTDEKSLNEMLLPQNDIECDNPEIIELASSLTQNAENKFDEVRAIYDYITITFYYDDVQIDDDRVYQDDALTLSRRQIAICEGYANLFVALCRARKIPSTVEFGLGKDSYVFFTDSDFQKSEVSNHAWAAVFIDGKWLFVDPTYDNENSFSGTSPDRGQYKQGTATHDYLFMTLETFSMCHKICDADTVHSIESAGPCGNTASYKLTRDGVLTIDGTGEIKLPTGLNGFTKVVFTSDSNITTIGEDCFRDCDLIESIILPKSVREIKKGAFKTCEDLKYVYLPEGLEKIGKQAFDFCDELAYVYVPDSVDTIDAYAFDDCPRLYLSVPTKFFDIADNYENVPFYIEVR